MFGGFEATMLLVGLLGGNIGAILIKPLNLGLLGNSLAGMAGAGLLLWGPALIIVEINLRFWPHLALSAISGLLAMALCGGLVALRYRD